MIDTWDQDDRPLLLVSLYLGSGRSSVAPSLLVPGDSGGLGPEGSARLTLQTCGQDIAMYSLLLNSKGLDTLPEQEQSTPEKHPLRSAAGSGS